METAVNQETANVALMLDKEIDRRVALSLTRFLGYESEVDDMNTFFEEDNIAGARRLLMDTLACASHMNDEWCRVITDTMTHKLQYNPEFARNVFEAIMQTDKFWQVLADALREQTETVQERVHAATRAW